MLRGASVPKIFDLGRQGHGQGEGFTSTQVAGSDPMVFQHSGAQDFDLGGGFHFSGSYPWCFNTVVATPTRFSTSRTIEFRPRVQRVNIR